MRLQSVFNVAIFFVNAHCYNILGVFLYDGESHFKVYLPLLKELSYKGHEVTVLSYFPLETNLSGYTDIFWENPELYVDVSYYTKLPSRIAKYASPFLITSGTEKRCELVLNTEQFRNVLKTIDKYDVIIAEFFDSNCFLYTILATKQIPFIGIQSHALLPWTNDWVANPHHPAYVPVIFFDYSNKMNFWERLENTLMWMYSSIYYNFVMKPQDFKMLQKHSEKGRFLDKDIISNTSVIFTNTHFSLHGARPLVPNVIEVGGIHIEEPKKLPTHLEKWINESTHGVIYFSFGSLIKGHTISEEKRQMIIRAFSRFPQRVLWKWETDTMPEKPENIMIEKWMPQFDILCHPNVKAFIAHGGLLGVTEAVHCGVPLIVMPQFGDQFLNAKAVEARGAGVIVDYYLFDEEIFYNALKTVLDPSFNKKAKEQSKRFQDRPVPPLETAVYWVEYVARHRGAHHLKTAAVGMPYYQYFLLDVLAFVIVMVFLLIYVIYVVSATVLAKKFNLKIKVKSN